MKVPSVETVSRSRDEVGESPVWDSADNCLRWVDIVGKKIRRFDPEAGTERQIETADFPTAVALRTSCRGAVVAFAGGVTLADPDSGASESLCMPDKMPGNRLNEGKCDPQGRFWVGSMQTNLNPDGTSKTIDRHSGALFRIDADGSFSRHSDHEYGISNTMEWSPERDIFYFADTLRNAIFAFDYRDDSGEIANRRVLFEGHSRGLPDGSCIDDDGCLWNARFGGGSLIRITPDGRIDRQIELPVTNPTSCAFGGPDLRTLFVTSARFTLDDEQLQANSVEGALLALQPGIAGPTTGRFAG